MVAGVCRPSTFSRSPAHVRSCGSVPSPLYKGERKKKRAAQRRRAPPQAAHNESHSFFLSVTHSPSVTPFVLPLQALRLRLCMAVR